MANPLPNLRLLRPTDEVLERLATRAAGASFTYDAVGATRGDPPDGFAFDEAEIPLGHGEDIFRAAIDAAEAWQMFDLPWIHFWAGGPPAEGRVAAFAALQFGVWSVQIVRIVYVERDDDGVQARWRAAYGTLPGHGLSGEEAFTVTWDRRTNEVRFRIHQFSVPATWANAAMHPVTRRVQHRFVVDALAALKQAATP